MHEEKTEAHQTPQKKLGASWSLVLVLGGIALLAIDTCDKNAQNRHAAATKREKTRYEAEERAHKSRLKAIENHYQRMEELEEKRHDRKYIDIGEFVKTYRREPAFADKVDAHGYNDSVLQGEYDLADFVLQDRTEKGTACRLRNGDEYEVVGVHGTTIQVYDPASNKSWWIADKYVREVED